MLPRAQATLLGRRWLCTELAESGRGRRVAQGSDEEFRPPYIRPVPFRSWTPRKQRPKRFNPGPPRKSIMKPEQDWPSVWPVQTSFKHSVVPLPIRMGAQKRPDKNPPPPAYANLELVKIPNFLHLTPKAIHRQCEALKAFCTPFPEELKDDAALDRHFPLTVTTKDWVHCGTSLREPRARAVTLSVKVQQLVLPAEARDKLLRLVQERYDHGSDLLSLLCDRCPRRHQNRQYAEYLLTVLYFESLSQEPWESEKAAADEAVFHWAGSQSEAALIRTLAGNIQAYQRRKAVEEDSVSSLAQLDHTSQVLQRLAEAEDLATAMAAAPEVQAYVATWDRLRNTPETQDSVAAYEASARALLGVPSLPPPRRDTRQPRVSRSFEVGPPEAQELPKTIEAIEVVEVTQEAEAKTQRPRLRPVTKATDLARLFKMEDKDPVKKSKTPKD